MSEAAKVIWDEGMFLQPQHMQQLERSLVGVTNDRVLCSNPYGYGFSELEVSGEALTNGVFSVTQCRGVMPDGTPFDLSAGSVIPGRTYEGRVRHDQDSVEVLLALPLVVPGVAGVAREGGAERPHARYRGRTAAVLDEVDGERSQSILLGDLNFSIRFAGESLQNHTSMPIAKLARSGDGRFAVDQGFVPPLLQISASEVLMGRLRGLLEVLLAKASSLGRMRKESPGGLAQFGPKEASLTPLLLAINTHAPLLNHCHYAPQAHPFALFSLLTQLSGALCTFTSRVSLHQLPRYDHMDLGAVTASFDRIIREALSADPTTGCIPVPLEKTGTSTYACKVGNEGLLSGGQFYLGVAASAPEKELIVGTLQRVKMCSRDRLELLIPSAMPGIPLRHVSSPPEGLSTKPGYVYFSLDQRGELWEGVRTSGSMAFYFPHNFGDLRMEMLALRK